MNRQTKRGILSMKSLRTLRIIALATLLLVAGYALLGPFAVSASAQTPPIVPDAIAVPDGATLLFSSHAAGMQTYECHNGLWAFRAPKATLFDPQTEHLTGIHYGGIDRGYTAGPWWESLLDGSRIRGGNAKSAPSPTPASIPLLRLEVLERYGTGVFSPVSYIQRLNTEGGVGPTGTCGAGAKRLVPYTADYYFYAAP